MLPFSSSLFGADLEGVFMVSSGKGSHMTYVRVCISDADLASKLLLVFLASLPLKSATDALKEMVRCVFRDSTNSNQKWQLIFWVCVSPTLSGGKWVRRESLDFPLFVTLNMKTLTNYHLFGLVLPISIGYFDQGWHPFQTTNKGWKTYEVWKSASIS